MVLTPAQWEKMYDISMANGTHIEWIREKLMDNDAIMNDRDERLRIVESDQAFMHGKMARLAGSVAAVCAIAVNGILWVITRFGGK